MHDRPTDQGQPSVHASERPSGVDERAGEGVERSSETTRVPAVVSMEGGSRSSLGRVCDAIEKRKKDRRRCRCAGEWGWEAKSPEARRGRGGREDRRRKRLVPGPAARGRGEDKVSLSIFGGGRLEEGDARDVDLALRLGSDGVKGALGEVERVVGRAGRAEVGDGDGHLGAGRDAGDVDRLAAAVRGLARVAAPPLVRDRDDVRRLRVDVAAGAGVAVLEEVGRVGVRLDGTAGRRRRGGRLGRGGGLRGRRRDGGSDLGSGLGRGRLGGPLGRRRLSGGGRGRDRAVLLVVLDGSGGRSSLGGDGSGGRGRGLGRGNALRRARPERLVGEQRVAARVPVGAGGGRLGLEGGAAEGDVAGVVGVVGLRVCER